MKKIIKKILITIGVLIVIIILFVLGYMFKAKSEINKMTPLETQKITEQIYSIKDTFTNIYLIQSNDGYIVIDGGNSIDNITTELSILNIDAKKVIALFLTHSDGDHVASVPLFKNAEVYLSKQEEQLLTGETSRFLFFGNKIECENYNLVEDNQVINISDLTIQCILTPGHTPGSTCYLINNNYLFTGDALSLIDGTVKDFNNLFNMDTKTQIQSIKKLSNLDSINFIFTAHHGMTNDFSFAFSDWKN
ncbi:MBL fold metallo-hydrolase [Bacteroidota bacterium]